MSQADYVREHFNGGAPIRHATRRLLVSDIATKCDLLKIDTDGDDLKALHGSEALIRRERPLVVICEAPFNGDCLSGRPSVASVGELLGEIGYTWLNIDTKRYRRAALPGRFCYSIPAETTEGPVGVADLTFVDDPLAAKGKLSVWLQGGLQRCYKLLALYDLIGFPDCAAELLLALSRHPLSASADDWNLLLQVLHHAGVTDALPSA